jgi:protein kinase-like protein
METSGRGGGGRELAPGEEFGGYVVEAVAGRGGMGVVYRARQRRPERVVALKVITPHLAEDESFRARFERESNVAAQIEHPNVIPVYEVNDHEGLLYITMRFVEGTDLRALIEREGPLDPARAVGIVTQSAAALDAAHKAGLVHRDVKPGNLLISSGGHAYLTDFGLAKQGSSQSGITKTGMFVGTLDYIAPEQLKGQPVDARADVYALACVLYQALTGQVPYPRGSDPAKIWAHMSEDPPHPTALVSVSHAFDEVIARGMAKDREQRYPSAGDLARAAAAALEGRDTVVGERSVATGPAAPGAGTVHDSAAPTTPLQASGATVHAAPGQPQAAAYAPPPASTAVIPQGPPPAHPDGPARSSQRRLWIAVAAAGALVATLVVLLVAGVFGGGGDGGAKLPDPGVYKGQTSAGDPLELTVAGGEVRDVTFDGNAACQNSQTGRSGTAPYQFRALPTTKAPLEKDGHFDIEVQLTEQTFRMQGDFSGTKAEGNLSWQYRADENGAGPLASGPVQCDTGPLGWNVSGG